MKSAHSTAISSNERIFPIFAKKFASKDTKEFLSTARKLTIWLGSEKAYYPVARPKVRCHLTAGRVIPITHPPDCRASRGAILSFASRLIVNGYRFPPFVLDRPFGFHGYLRASLRHC